ncbi:fragment of putative Zn-containing alcohol dehydrogenase, partial [Aromatoleum aromaticum EbN1]
HILTQVLACQHRPFYTFTRAGDDANQTFARALVANWAGAAGENPPDELDVALIFAPAGEFVPAPPDTRGTNGPAAFRPAPRRSFTFDLLRRE